MEHGTTPFGPEDLLASAAWMRRLALSLARDEAAADDLVQETWLKALERRGPDRGPTRGWLRAVLRNFAFRRMRSERRLRARELRAASPESSEATSERLLERVELERRGAGLVLR